jgi:hypothetical protein
LLRLNGAVLEIKKLPMYDTSANRHSLPGEPVQIEKQQSKLETAISKNRLGLEVATRDAEKVLQNDQFVEGTLIWKTCRWLAC